MNGTSVMEIIINMIEENKEYTIINDITYFHERLFSKMFITQMIGK